MEIDLEKIRHVHFIGIGGIGVSAIARLMHIAGKTVSGSDLSASPVTDRLSALGISVIIGHDPKNIPANTDLVVYTIAIPETNPELREAVARNIPVMTYPQMLSIISKNKKTIAVSGTHGKTTTTAMISKILIDANLHPTVIIGSLMKDSDSNLITGDGEYLLVEACEYRRSFLNLYPTILIITNIDADHLDYYKDIADIQSAFRELAERIPENGTLICNTNDPRLKPVIKNLKCKVIDYTKYIKNLILKAPGRHNKENAAAALAVADFIKIQHAEKSLENFSGTWRRFDLKGATKNGTLVYDDYAHHPQEIKATLSGMKEMYPDKKRIAFFQPHLFSRTKSLFDEFADAFEDVDTVYLLPIYAARENFDESISSEMLARKIKNASFVENFKDAVTQLQLFGDDTVVVNMGAGNIYTLSELALENND